MTDQTKTPNTFTMPTDLAQRLVNYLEKRPYHEVARLLAEILACNPS